MTKQSRTANADASPLLPLDDLDRRLIHLLLEDVRISNRSLANELGISSVAVGNRIKKLNQAGLVTTTVVIDWKAAGYTTSAFVFIKTQPGKAEAVARQLADRPCLHSIARSLGEADLILSLLVQSPEELRREIDLIQVISGVADINVDIKLEYHRYEFRQYMRPSVAWSLDDLPSLDIDDVDRQIIDGLRQDGQLSNRALARAIEVSEGTVRARLQRMESDNVLRVVAMADPFILGEAFAAYVCIKVEGCARTQVCNELLACEQLPVLATCIGRYDLVGIMFGRSLVELASEIQHVGAQLGVSRLDVYPIVDVNRVRPFLVRLPEPNRLAQ